MSVEGKSKADQSFGVPVLGVLLNHSWLGQRAAIYGNVAALGLGSGEGSGGPGEAGFSYAARFLPFGFTVAVQYRIFHYDKRELVLNGQPRTRDETIGILAGIHFTK